MTTKQNDKRLSYIFGTISLLSLFIIAIVIPNPTASSYSIFKTILSLSAAGVGAAIPGFLDINYKGILRASGAIALFIIVYFFTPAPPNDGNKINVDTNNGTVIDKITGNVTFTSSQKNENNNQK